MTQKIDYWKYKDSLLATLVERGHDLTSGEYKMFGALVSYYNPKQQGLCFPSQDALANYIGIKDKNRVRKLTQSLHNKGWIKLHYSGRQIYYELLNKRRQDAEWGKKTTPIDTDGVRKLHLLLHPIDIISKDNRETAATTASQTSTYTVKLHLWGDKHKTLKLSETEATELLSLAKAAHKGKEDTIEFKGNSVIVSFSFNALRQLNQQLKTHYNTDTLADDLKGTDANERLSI